MAAPTAIGGREFHSGICVALNREIWHNDVEKFKKESPHSQHLSRSVTASRPVGMERFRPG